MEWFVTECDFKRLSLLGRRGLTPERRVVLHWHPAEQRAMLCASCHDLRSAWIPS